MTPSQFQKVLDRDGGRCVHCGTTSEGLVPQHRKNRGMGGFPPSELPANIVVLCASFNAAIESDADAAAFARERGWKLRPWDIATLAPVYDAAAERWYLLTDDFRRIELTTGNVVE